MYWRDVLTEMGFVQVEEGDTNVYKSGNLGDTKFDFSSRQSADAIAAEIWDKAQQYGENEMRKRVSRNMFREL